MVGGFFRLHRRRQLSDNGFQPLSYGEICDYCDKVKQVHPSLRDWLIRTLEEIDNGVLYDYYQKQTSARESNKATKKR